MTEQQIGSRNEKGREESESQGGNIRKWTVISGIRVQAKGKWEKITKKWTRTRRACGRPAWSAWSRPQWQTSHCLSSCSSNLRLFCHFPLFYFLSRLAPSLLLLSHTDSLHTRWTPRALAMFFQPIFSSVHHMVSVSFPSILWETMLNFPPCCYNLNSWLLTLLLNLIKKKLDATGRLSKLYLQLLYPATLSAYLQHYWYISVWVSSSFYLHEAKESCRLQRLRHISVKNMNQCNKSSFLK